MAEHRCRLCTSNDQDALVEHLAERFWRTQGDATDTRTWAEAGDYWQRIFRQFAVTAIDAMRA